MLQAGISSTVVSPCAEHLVGDPHAVALGDPADVGLPWPGWAAVPLTP